MDNAEMQQKHDEAVLLMESGRVAEGMAMWKTLIDAGHVDTIREMGIVVATGKYDAPIDYYVSGCLFKMGADQGDLVCAYNLANQYEHGLGCEPDAEVAYELYNFTFLSGMDRAAEKVANFNLHCKIAEPDLSYAKTLVGALHMRNMDDQCEYMRGLVHITRHRPGDNVHLSGDEEGIIETGKAHLRNAQLSKASTLLRFMESRMQAPPEKEVFSMQALHELLEKEDDGTYIYRGQTRMYPPPLVESFRRECRYSLFPMEGVRALQLRKTGRAFYYEAESTLYNGKSWKVKRILSRYFNSILGYPMAQTLFQQAGYSSEGLDVTEDYRIAFFFATQDYDLKTRKYAPYAGARRESVLYRWKRPAHHSAEDLLYTLNYFHCGNYIPSQALLKGIGSCKGHAEFEDSVRTFLQFVHLNPNMYLLFDRPYSFLRFPEKSLENCRIFKQKAGLLLSDVIFSDASIDKYAEMGYTPATRSGLGANMVQDLSEPGFCEAFRFIYDPELAYDSGYQDRHDLYDLYDGAREDVTHALIDTIFRISIEEERFSGLLSGYAGEYGLTGGDVVAQVDRWQEDREKAIYFVD